MLSKFALSLEDISQQQNFATTLFYRCTTPMKGVVMQQSWDTMEALQKASLTRLLLMDGLVAELEL